MKRFVAAALSLLCVWTVTRLVAQDSPDPVFEPFPSASPDDPGLAEPAAEPQADNSQQSRFLEIMRTKAELMDDAELNAAIQQAEAEIKNLQASRMLTDARNTLLQLIETYPETPAAHNARRMLSLEIDTMIQPPRPTEDFEPSFTLPAETIGVEELPDFERPVFDEPQFEETLNPPADSSNVEPLDFDLPAIDPGSDLEVGNG